MRILRPLLFTGAALAMPLLLTGPASAALTFNALTFNALTFNSLTLNALTFNGLSAFGLSRGDQGSEVSLTDIRGLTLPSGVAFALPE